MSVHNCSGPGGLGIPPKRKPLLSISTKINMYNNCREKYAMLSSARRGTSAIIVSWRIQMNYPGRKTILCIDDDGGMLDYQKALLERRGYRCSLRTPPDKAYRLQQCALLLP